MLNVFKKIRKRILNLSYQKNYLIYAIGEIVLVMIGILLALQVNNWNEGRKNRTFERQILTELLHDIEKDTADIHYQIRRFHGIMERVDYWRTYGAHKDSANLPLGGILGGLYFNLNMTTFETLQGKGLHSLENNALRRSISEYYSKCQWYLDMVNMTSRDFYTIFQEPFKKEHMHLIYDKNDSRGYYSKQNTSLLGSEEFNSFLAYKKENLDYEVLIYYRIINQAEESIKSIQSYLDKKFD